MPMPQRIASMIAASTEIVCALGFERDLVARSHECDFPESVRRLPVVTETKFNPDGTSYQIDERVKAILQEGLSVYRVMGEKLRALAPDVIITQIQCEVCAVSRKDVEEAVYGWMDHRPRIVSLNPNSLADVWEDIRSVARALDAPERGDALVTKLRARIEREREKGASRGRVPTVACIEWIDPLMAAGNWVPELVELAGGQNLFGEAGKHSPWMKWEEVVKKDPDVIIVMPCGWDIERSSQEMPALEKSPGWASLTAVRQGNVVLVDGNQFFNRPGPRVVESLEITREILDRWANPSLFSSRGTGWKAWPR
jgi:iron complex transport system substrate-binding protein